MLQNPPAKLSSSKALPIRLDGLRAIFSKQKDLPILGRAAGGTGNMVIEDGPIDWTQRPSNLSQVRDAFAVYVTGNSMDPKYKDGDLAYIHPRKKLIKDRYVLVETIFHTGLIKQYVGWKDDTLLLRQYNPDKMITLPRNEIRNVMLVIGSMDA